MRPIFRGYCQRCRRNRRFDAGLRTCLDCKWWHATPLQKAGHVLSHVVLFLGLAVIAGVLSAALFHMAYYGWAAFAPQSNHAAVSQVSR